MVRPHPRLAQNFLWSLTAFTIVLWFTEPKFHWLHIAHPLTMAVGIVIVVISESWPLEAARGSTISLASAGYLAVFLVAGPVEAFWTILLGRAVSWIRDFRWMTTVASTALMLLSLDAAQAVARVAHRQLFVALLFAATFIVLNHLFVNVYYFLRDGYQRRQEILGALFWDSLAWAISLPLVAIFILLDRAYPHRITVGLLGLLPYVTVTLLLSFYYQTRVSHRMNALTADASEMITSAMTKDDLVRAIHQGMGEVIGFEVFVMYLLDPGTGHLTRASVSYPLDDAPYPEVFVRGGESLTDWALATRTPEFIRDAREHPSAHPDPEDAHPVVSGFVLPLRTDHKIWGFIVMGYSVPNRYDRHDFEMAKVLASHAAMAYRKWLLQEEALLASRSDPVLPGVHNFRYFHEVLSERLQEEPQRVLTLAFLDMDNFKAVNDRYGHMMGDRVLNRLAELVQLELRPRDFMARYGGDEFVVVLDGADGAGAAVALDRIQRKLENQNWADVAIPLGVSGGYATYPQDGKTAEELLNVADARMYKNKLARKAIFQKLSSS